MNQNPRCPSSDEQPKVPVVGATGFAQASDSAPATVTEVRHG